MTECENDSKIQTIKHYLCDGKVKLDFLTILLFSQIPCERISHRSLVFFFPSFFSIFSFLSFSSFSLFIFPRSFFCRPSDLYKMNFFPPFLPSDCLFLYYISINFKIECYMAGMDSSICFPST